MYNVSVAGVAQLVEQHIRNVWVGGSIPPIGLIKPMSYKNNKGGFILNGRWLFMAILAM